MCKFQVVDCPTAQHRLKYLLVKGLIWTFLKAGSVSALSVTVILPVVGRGLVTVSLLSSEQILSAER